MVKVQLRTVQGDLLELDVDEPATIGAAKRCFESSHHLPLSSVRLLVAGDDSSPLPTDVPIIVQRSPRTPARPRPPSPPSDGPPHRQAPRSPACGDIRDPPGFSKAVKRLPQVEPDITTCERALRAADYNLWEAAEALFGTAGREAQAAGAGLGSGGFGGERRFGNRQDIFDALADREKEAVHAIEREGGLRPEDALRLYLACDKNSGQAMVVIGTMKKS